MVVTGVMLFQIVEQFATELRRGGGPQVYDFGDAQCIVPMHREGSYLTSSAVMLYVPGPGPLPLGAQLPSADGEVKVISGWKFIATHINLSTSISDVWKKLRAAKAQLESWHGGTDRTNPNQNNHVLPDSSTRPKD